MLEHLPLAFLGLNLPPDQREPRARIMEHEHASTNSPNPTARGSSALRGPLQRQGLQMSLYRSNLEKGQTGLSIAFDLPTQCGYDSDDPMARPEVGKVGVPINRLGRPTCSSTGSLLEKMNTSMTINATVAAWLLGLYAAAENTGVTDQPWGTTQNDIIKEYLPRHLRLPPRPMRLIATWSHSP